MLYFKNSEIAKKFHVSLGTVRNWIESARLGKVRLVLYSEHDRDYIANTPENQATLSNLVIDNRKYRNTRSFRDISPDDRFYELYTPEQIYDIIKNLEVHHEIPRDYNYFDNGADSWHKYVERLAEENQPNLLNQTIKMLDNNLTYLDKLLEPYRTVNILDIGAGNAMPVKKLIAHYLKQGKLGRYIAVDISPKMLDIAKRNVKRWYDGKVAYEGYALDIKKDRFTSILYREYMKKDAKTANIILLVGGTLSNFKDPNSVLKVINESMGTHDFFVHTQLLDTDRTRSYFNFNNTPASGPVLAKNHRLIFDLLNIDESLYEVEMGYNSKSNERYIRVRLKVAINISFSFDEGERTISLNKDDYILLWRHRHRKSLDVIDLFDKNGFHLLQTQQTEDQEYILTVSKVKH
jgi:SAM-dependent methyltransferase